MSRYERSRCLNCGKELRLKWEWVPGSKVNQGYCCRKCYNEKPPVMAYLERIHGKPIREVVIQLLNKHSVTVTSDMLGISRQSFYSYMAKLKIKRGRWEWWS